MRSPSPELITDTAYRPPAPLLATAAAPLEATLQMRRADRSNTSPWLILDGRFLTSFGLAPTSRATRRAN